MFLLVLSTNTIIPLGEELIELQYREDVSQNVQSVLDDIFNTSICLCLKGFEIPKEFKLLQDGINKVRGFIHSEK